MKASHFLLSILDELGAADFKRFRWNLTQQVLDGCKPILKGQLESADRQDTVSKMIENYGEDIALILAVEILRMMNHNNAADRLERFAGGSAAAQNSLPTSYSSSSFSGLAPAEGAKKIIVAPQIQGTQSGASVNVNINTSHWFVMVYHLIGILNKLFMLRTLKSVSAGKPGCVWCKSDWFIQTYKTVFKEKLYIVLVKN